MKIWRAKNITHMIGLVLLMIYATAPTSKAQEKIKWPELTWSDRLTTENSDGSLKDQPPFVAIKGVPLRRFSDMQRIKLESVLVLEVQGKTEKVAVFKVWQGAAGMGEQLVLLTSSPEGIELIGPHPNDFEKLKIVRAKKTQGPLFLLYGGNDAPHSVLEYVAGELLDKK